ncbi:serine hydrolase domain-containing protein [Pseudomarimonas salicorniae]|uniref:Serine hydrolase n=1 Tax=Pseudomarimonas salicorniae TaxID=2933270 RepID=A0ABT0GGU8_9GAMM|nr:serine hydrolase [Lysobacter sp. CAU 1642]MCK7593763.1 serine hydrolase [Lysobacter sp. CAU 1642]
MRHLALGLALLLLASAGSRPALADAGYFPPRGEWARATPAEMEVDAAALQRAIDAVRGHENPAPRDQAIMWAQGFGSREPYFGGLLGPTSVRADGVVGLVIHRGRVLAEFGDTERVDMTHSVVKSVLSTVVGLAHDRGLIADLDAPVARLMPPDVDLFESAHNASISWDMLLRQTSDWQGTLWGRPDWADRPEGEPEQWPQTPRHTPGSRYEYNDVRINVLALAALQVWRRPLPEVLRERIMDPIGASTRWRWHGYRNSWVTLDGQKMQSVSGGGHWGGGLFIDAWDLARFGYLILREGRWGDRQLIGRVFLARAATPGAAKADYGYANWFLNPGRKALPSAPEDAITFRGNGQNIVYIDRRHDLLIVLRWIDGDAALDAFIGAVIAALPESARRPR